ncbi:DsrE family protein [Jiulongibacter sp. NS-SX5]|uniref:DsrE family protein n=1 Tax=Jiulongibacter sp. NS-SX5 TaxID=3463854 RepID=UPI004058728D
MKLIISSILLFCTISAFGQSQQTHKIVFQMATDVQKEQSSLARQLNNVLDYWPDAEIEVVVHSAAIQFMMKDQSIVESEILKLQKRGVTFAVCRNTMKRKGVEENQIITGAHFVPVGIAEIVEKQESGFAYIKAGY